MIGGLHMQNLTQPRSRFIVVGIANLALLLQSTISQQTSSYRVFDICDPVNASMVSNCKYYGVIKINTPSMQTEPFSGKGIFMLG
ncbi:hypothetical protein F5Y14DRAFT_423736 [Nemania sp. NC0429]|nr:hypothetical protein F5Y14DRAFT_423736 [Nemania sp. NC0429]